MPEAHVWHGLRRNQDTRICKGRQYDCAGHYLTHSACHLQGHRGQYIEGNRTSGHYFMLKGDKSSVRAVPASVRTRLAAFFVPWAMHSLD